MFEILASVRNAKAEDIAALVVVCGFVLFVAFVA